MHLLVPSNLRCHLVAEIVDCCIHVFGNRREMDRLLRKKDLDAHLLPISLVPAFLGSECHIDTRELVTPSPERHDSPRRVLVHSWRHPEIVSTDTRIHSVVSLDEPAWEVSHE